MGFGLLFAGYFTATIMSLNSLGMVFAVVGYGLMVWAFSKLSEYNKGFRLPLFASFPMIAIALVQTAGWAFDFLYEQQLVSHALLSNTANNVLSVLWLIFELAFAGCLCYAVKEIATETGAAKIPYVAVRNFIFQCISFALQIFGAVCKSGISKALVSFYGKVGFFVFELAFPLLVMVLFCVMLFSCYRQICDAQDVDMPVKPSRFAFINRQREERERKRAEFSAKYEKYKEEKTASRQNSQGSTHKKKKKHKK